MLGKVMCKLSKGKINPMIGAAGVSAVPMAARVVHKIGLEEDKSNYLLMHAIGTKCLQVLLVVQSLQVYYSVSSDKTPIYIEEYK